MKCSLYENKLSLFINVFSLIQKRSKKGLWWRKLIAGIREELSGVLDEVCGLLWSTIWEIFELYWGQKSYSSRFQNNFLKFFWNSRRILRLKWGSDTIKENQEDFEAVSNSFKGTLDLLDHFFHLEDFIIREIQRYLNFSCFKKLSNRSRNP